MERRKRYKQIRIDVEPFLSIMAIVLKLISLILVVIVMRIAVNPKGIKVVDLLGRQTSHGVPAGQAKEPSYIDCFQDRLVLYPANVTNTWDELLLPDSAVEKLLDQIQVSNRNQYVIVMARPESLKVFRQVRKLISQRPINVGFDVVAADFKVNWNEAVKRLQVAE